MVPCNGDSNAARIRGRVLALAHWLQLVPILMPQKQRAVGVCVCYLLLPALATCSRMIHHTDIPPNTRCRIVILMPDFGLLAIDLVVVVSITISERLVQIIYVSRHLSCKVFYSDRASLSGLSGKEEKISYSI